MQPCGSGSLRLFGSGSGCRFGSGLWYVMMIGFGQCPADESLITVMSTDLKRIAAAHSRALKLAYGARHSPAEKERDGRAWQQHLQTN